LIVKDRRRAAGETGDFARATTDLHEKMLPPRRRPTRSVFPRGMQGEGAGSPADAAPTCWIAFRLDDRNSNEEIKVPSSFIGQSLRDLNLRKNYEVKPPGSRACEQLSVKSTASMCSAR